MLVQILPDTMTKFAQMGDATIYEPAGDQPQATRRRVPYQSHSLADGLISNFGTRRSHTTEEIQSLLEEVQLS